MNETTEMKLTKREQMALNVYVAEGELSEGWIYEHCWPEIRNVRLVTNSLVRKGLVTLGAWLDPGYELILTDAGKAALDA